MGPAPVNRASLRRLSPTVLLPVLALPGLVLLLFSDAVFRGRVFYDRDIHLEWYPQIESFVRAVAAGSWPVWNNSVAFGQPLLADPSAQVLYPATWLNLAILPWTYYTVFVVLHLTFAAFGLYVLARALGLSTGGAMAAAALWTLSGPLLSLVNVWHHFAGAAWIPWVFLAAHKACKSGRPAHSLLWALAQAGQVLAGSADMCAMTVLLVMAYAALHLRWREPTAMGNRRLVGAAALAVVVALALSAAVWLPALDVSRRSSRAALPEAQRTQWSVPFWGLPQVVFPVFVKDLPLKSQTQAALFDATQPFLASLYLGLAAVGLGAAAVGSGRRRLTAFLAGLGMAALLVALGRHTPFYHAAITLLPPLKILRYPMKTMIVTALAWSLLTGMGFDAWMQAARNGRLRTAALLVGILGLLAGGSALLVRGAPEVVGRLLLDTPAVPASAELLRGLVWNLGLASLAGLTVSALALARVGGGGAVLPPVMALAAAGDLFVAHRGLIPTAPRELLTFRPPAIEALGAPNRTRLYVYEYFLTPGSSRRYLGRDDPYVVGKPPLGLPLEQAQVLSQRLYLFPPVGGRWGFEGSFDIDTRGLYSVELSQLAWLLRSVEGTPAHTRLLRLGAVGFVMALHETGFEDLEKAATLPSLFPEPIRIFRVPDPIPRTYTVGATRIARGTQALTTLLDESFDPRKEAVLAEGEPREGAGFRGRSRIVEFRPDRVWLEAELSDPGFVVLVDAYDPGWQATVDGQPAPVVRANVAFRAVFVEAGQHVVEFTYRPWSVRAGVLVSGATLAALAVVGLLLRMPSRTSGPEAGPGQSAEARGLGVT